MIEEKNKRKQQKKTTKENNKRKQQKKTTRGVVGVGGSTFMTLRDRYIHYYHKFTTVENDILNHMIYEGNFDGNVTITKLAESYNVSTTTIYRLVRKLEYDHFNLFRHDLVRGEVIHEQRTISKGSLEEILIQMEDGTYFQHSQTVMEAMGEAKKIGIFACHQYAGLASLFYQQLLEKKYPVSHFSYFNTLLGMIEDFDLVFLILDDTGTLYLKQLKEALGTFHQKFVIICEKAVVEKQMTNVLQIELNCNNSYDFPILTHITLHLIGKSLKVYDKKN